MPWWCDLPCGILARTGRKGNLLDLSEGADRSRHARWPAALLRAERPIWTRGSQLHQSRVARSQPEGSGVSHVSRRLRDCENSVGVLAAEEGEELIVVSS